MTIHAQYDMNHVYLIRLVLLKRPGFQLQKYGMLSYICFLSDDEQARNQLGTPGVAKSILRRFQTF